MRNDSGWFEMLLFQAGIFAIALLPFVLAIKLLQFALSSKESAIFTACMGGVICLMLNAPNWNLEFELPFEKMLQDAGYVEKS